MTLRAWGKALLLWGTFGALLSGAPVLLLLLLPPLWREGVLGVTATLLAFSVTPLMLIVASVGAILWLVAALRRDPF